MKQWEVQWLDYYKTLQVSPVAEPEVIKAAYGKLAQIHHPDKNEAPDASQKMAELNEAYACLSNPVERAAYDQCYSTYDAVQEIQGGPKPSITPASVSLGKLALGKSHCCTFRADNLGDVEKEEVSLDYWPKVPWLAVSTDSSYLPFDIVVEIDTSELQPDTKYEGEVHLTLDGVTARAQFDFQTLDVVSSLEGLLGTSFMWAR